MLLSIIQTFILLSGAAMSQGSVCGRYDLSVHPDQVRTNLLIKCMREGATFYLDGMIDENMIFEIRNFASEPIRTLYLNSTGGKVSEAIQVAEFIRAQGIVTVIREGAVCKSACTLLYQAGVERWSFPENILMFHGVRDPFLPQAFRQQLRQCWLSPQPDCMAQIEERREELIEITEELFRLYQLYGASPELENHYWGLEEVEEWWESGNYIRIRDWPMTALESMEYGITTHLLTEPYLVNQ